MKDATPEAPLRGDEEKEYEYDRNNYYGRNDLRPNSVGKRICIYIGLIIFSPIVIALLVLYAIVVAYYLLFKIRDIHEYQIKSGKLLGFEMWFRAPGKIQRVVPTPENAPDVGDGTPQHASSDILISQDLIRRKEDGTKTNILDTGRNISLCKSIQVTVNEDLQQSPHGAAIRANRDLDKPRYLLHGWGDPLNPQDEEFWFTHARTSTWAGIYSWTKQLPMGRGMLEFNSSIPLDGAPEVFGYIYLMEVTNPRFYEKERISKTTAQNGFAPEHTPETEDKIFARYNYGKVRYMGDFPKGDPDAYIFKGRKVIEEANLRVIHRYRIIKPTADLST